MSNFQFLQQEWPAIFKEATEAEEAAQEEQDVDPLAQLLILFLELQDLLFVVFAPMVVKFVVVYALLCITQID